VKEDPIDPEKLAAFLDGTLNEAEREEVLRQLARSRRAFETLAGAAAILTEIDDQSKAVRRNSWLRAVPGSTRWLVQRGMLLGAVMLVVGVTAAVVRAKLGTRPGNPVALAESVAESLTAVEPGDAARRLPRGWPDPVWSVVRSDAFPIDPRVIDDEASAFRIGIRIVTLEFAWRYDAVLAESIGQELIGLLESIDGATPMAARYRALVSGASTAEEQRAAVRDLRIILLDSPWFDLGAWTEAARLAALAEAGRFFDTRVSRSALQSAASRLKAHRANRRPAPAALERIVELTRGGVAASEWVGLRSALASMIVQSAG
jgi:hypothetical protein